MIKIAKYVIYDILRSKVILAYTAFLLAVSLSLFLLDNDPAKSLISLMSIAITVIPLVSIIFATTWFYNAAEFTELLAAQPLPRISILIGQYMGLALSLLIAITLGIGIPLFIWAPGSSSVALYAAASTLSLAFISLAFLTSVATRDKAKGIGISLLVWFYCSVIYDGIILAILFAFSDYPLERIVILLASLNPIDLGRIIVLLHFDISALMGFTGAVYKQFFGTPFGLIYSFVLMSLWIIVPLTISMRIFRRKNI